MADDPTSQERARARAAQRRRLAEIFGDVIPDQTSDDAAEDQPDRPTGDQAQEDWLKRQVPPHHG